MIKKIIKFFDKLEDKVRASLSRRPILYTLIGAVAIVLFWRGVWMVADMFPFLTGPVSILISVVILLITGVFVSFFIGEGIILSGLKKEKKLVEKTEAEIKTETEKLADKLTGIETKLQDIEKDLEELKSKNR